MDQAITYIINQFGILGAISVLLGGIVCYVVWYFIKQIKEQPKAIEKLGISISENLSSKLLEAINENNERTTELFSKTLHNQFEANYKLLECLLNKPNEEKEAHDKQIEQMTDLDEKIINLITELKILTHSDRVGILQFHNGSFNIDGLPFKEYDLKYEVQSKGVNVIQKLVDRLPSSNLVPIIRDTADVDTVVYDEEKLHQLYERSAPLYHYLVEKLNCKIVIYSTLYSISTNKLIGFVVIEYQDDDENYKKHFSENELEDIRLQISALLSLKKQEE